MHAELRVSYTVPHEIQRLTGRVDASALARRATCLRGILDPRGRRLPWGRSLYRAPVDGHLPRPRSPWPCRPTGLGAATDADADSGEDRPALADREPSAPWLRDRVVDRPAPGPVDPGGVRSPSPPEIPQRLAARPGVHPAEAATRPPRARPEGNRRVVEVRLAAHQEQSPTTGCLHRPDRRKWPTDGSAGPPDLVASRPDAGPGTEERHAREGLCRGGPGAVATAGPARAVLPYFYCNSFPNILSGIGVMMGGMGHPRMETPPCRSLITPKLKPCSPTPWSCLKTSGSSVTTSRASWSATCHGSTGRSSAGTPRPSSVACSAAWNARAPSRSPGRPASRARTSSTSSAVGPGMTRPSWPSG